MKKKAPLELQLILKPDRVIDRKAKRETSRVLAGNHFVRRLHRMMR